LSAWHPGIRKGSAVDRAGRVEEEEEDEEVEGLCILYVTVIIYV
jgi:hypothetical protein